MVSERHEDWRDAALRRGILLPPPLRTWAARLAAGRGLAVPALRAGASDPLVLARLGLHDDAIGATGGGRRGEIGRAASAAALGDYALAHDLLARKAPLSGEDRRLLARGLAFGEPLLAAQVLPRGDAAARAACALAGGEMSSALKCLREAPPNRETNLVAALVAARTQDWRGARRSINAAFTVDGVAAPLNDESTTPPRLSSFGEAWVPRPAVDGPLVSVILPARNAEVTLEMAIGSLRIQTWHRLEIVIVDDRSSDSTAAIATRLAHSDARVRLIHNSRAPGAYGARNAGVEAARGVLVAFHDADDWAHPERLERQMRAIQGGACASLARYFRLTDQGLPFSSRVFPLARLSPMAVVAPTAAWRAVGPFEETQVGADSEWLARFEERFGRRAMARTPAIGFVARWAAGSLSTTAASGMSGAGMERRRRYERDWRWRHAGLGQFAPTGAFAPAAGSR